LYLAENFTLPMIWSPQHLNFKHLYYKKPACNGKFRCVAIPLYAGSKYKPFKWKKYRS